MEPFDRIEDHTFLAFLKIHAPSLKKGVDSIHCETQTVTLPMCSVNFIDRPMSVEEHAIADRIQGSKISLAMTC